MKLLEEEENSVALNRSCASAKIRVGGGERVCRVDRQQEHRRGREKYQQLQMGDLWELQKGQQFFYTIEEGNRTLCWSLLAPLSLLSRFAQPFFFQKKNVYFASLFFLEPLHCPTFFPSPVAFSRRSSLIHRSG